ncbi:MAG: hypothetical protein M3120_08690 [Pseudomonadota bacterium]|nr:hypothetical protein [Pseudomonadota bacterium]
MRMTNRDVVALYNRTRKDDLVLIME